MAPSLEEYTDYSPLDFPSKPYPSLTSIELTLRPVTAARLVLYGGADRAWNNTRIVHNESAKSMFGGRGGGGVVSFSCRTGTWDHSVPIWSVDVLYLDLIDLDI